MRIVGAFLLVLISTIVAGMIFLVRPNTYLSQINISWWPKPLVKVLLTSKKNDEISVMADARETKIHYFDLGMNLDVDKTMETLSFKSVRELINEWIYPTPKLIQPFFTFPEDFESKAEGLFPNEKLKDENYYWDDKTNLFEYKATERKARIDTVDLLAKLITFTERKNKPLMVDMVSERSELEKEINLINKKLLKVFSEPLELIFNSRQKAIISEDELKSFVKPAVSVPGDSITLDVDQKKVAGMIRRNQMDLSTEWATSLIKDNLMKRFNGEKAGTILIAEDSGPNSDGTLAGRYIEVDLSQQKMFFFDNNKLYKTYNVSTGLKYPTPVGNYKIKNKLAIGYSSIFNVWMPWWMAFDYREDIQAYLGIHELPYKLENGQRIYRFGNYIGNRKTGGCIALNPGDSKEVYDNSFPGMDLVIYQ